MFVDLLAVGETIGSTMWSCNCRYVTLKICLQIFSFWSKYPVTVNMYKKWQHSCYHVQMLYAVHRDLFRLGIDFPKNEMVIYFSLSVPLLVIIFFHSKWIVGCNVNLAFPCSFSFHLSNLRHFKSPLMLSSTSHYIKIVSISWSKGWMLFLFPFPSA